GRGIHAGLDGGRRARDVEAPGARARPHGEARPRMTMRVRLRFFAMLREKLGSEAECRVRTGATVAAVWRGFVAEHPEVARVQVRFAVDEAYVEPAHRLADGDEVAVCPPLSGCSGPRC